MADKRNIERLLLVQPPYTIFRDEAKGCQAPLGLGYLAAVMEPLLDVRVLDAVAEGYATEIGTGESFTYGLADGEIGAELSSYQPHVVGVSRLFSTQWRNAHRVCRLAKEVNPDVITVMGGAHPSATLSQTLADPNVDYVVVGEGEAALLALVNALRAGRPPVGIEGIAYRDGERVAVTPRQHYIDDLDTLPFPARHLLPMEKYFAINRPHGTVARRSPNTSLITSRGCPARCVFCSIHGVWGRKFRARSPENVLNELELLVRDYGVREVHFEDDNLTFDRSRAKAIFEGIVERGLDLAWVAPNGLATYTLDGDLLAAMKASGCYRLHLAVESGDPDVLRDIIRKPLRLEMVTEVVSAAKRLGLAVDAFFVVGFPGETLDQIHWCQLKPIMSLCAGKQIGLDKSLSLRYKKNSCSIPYPERSTMSRTTVSKPKPISKRKTPGKRQRFNQATRRERQTKLDPPPLTPDQAIMRQLLPGEKLKALARSRSAGDVRERKLTCTMFFWIAVLAFGPGGPITLHKVLTYALVADAMAGVGTLQALRSKEAVSENFRERPWPFFEAVLQYLLMAYASLWSQLAGQPNLEVVRQLHVLLVDATVMRVAHQLIDVFPASANGKCKAWAAVKLHTSLRLFRGVPEVLALTAQKKNERKISFLRPLGEAVLYIFDLGYWTYALFDTIIDRQQHFISRLRADCNPRILKVYIGDPQWVGQRLKDIMLKGREIDCLVNVSSVNPANPQMRHNVRLVGQWIAKDQDWHLYITSLVAWQKYPLTLIIDLYRLRWQIEILFRNLKHVLRMANFVSITQNGIRIQMYAALIHYMLTHLIILKAMQETGRPLEDFSIPYCLEAVQQVLQQAGALVLKGRTPNWDELEQLLVHAVIALGLRPNRKRKPLVTKVKARLWRTAPLPAGGP